MGKSDGKRSLSSSRRGMEGGFATTMKEKNLEKTEENRGKSIILILGKRKLTSARKGGVSIEKKKTYGRENNSTN